MTFWRSQTGPAPQDASPADDRDPIAEIVCPRCNNVLAWLYPDPEGIAVRSWVPAGTHHKSLGWTLYGVIDDTVEDDEEVPTHCWRGHHGLYMTPGLFREAVQAYRSRATKKARRPALERPTQ